jgi:hypothetical protein
MKFSEHAKNKLEIYGIEGKEIIKECHKPLYEFYDTGEDAYIKIIELEKIPFVVVLDNTIQTIITVYRTDYQTITKRNKNKRWT